MKLTSEKGNRTIGGGPGEDWGGNEGSQGTRRAGDGLGKPAGPECQKEAQARKMVRDKNEKKDSRRKTDPLMAPRLSASVTAAATRIMAAVKHMEAKKARNIKTRPMPVYMSQGVPESQLTMGERVRTKEQDMPMRYTTTWLRRRDRGTGVVNFANGRDRDREGE